MTGAAAPSAGLRRDLARLGGTLAGEVLLPGSARYEAARKPAVVRFWEVRPRAVVRCASAADVAHALGFARRAGLPVVPRGGGHCFAGRSSTEGIVLDLTQLRSVSVSADGTATVGAGAKLGGVYDALYRHGRTLPLGCGEDVGITGLTLGGGLGLLGRRYGLTCDRLRAASVVLADGRVVECDEWREPDLFWALRGAGGGQFGVLTSLVFGTVPAPEATRFVLAWPPGAAAAVISAWQRWAPGAPDELTGNLKVAAADAAGPVQVTVFGAMLGSAAQTLALTRELAALAGDRPVSEEVAELPYPELKRSLAGIGEGADGAGGSAGPGPVTSKSEFFARPLPDDAVSGLLGLFGADRMTGQRRELNFTVMGGAYNRVPAEATAFAHRGELFLLEHAVAGTEGSAALPDGAAGWARRSWACAHEWGSGHVYPNFPDPELAGWAEAYHGANYERLTRVKRRYDPGQLLRFPQSVPPG